MSVFTTFLTKTKNATAIASDNLNNLVFPVPASKYTQLVFSYSVNALKDATLSNVSPSLKLVGSALKDLWAASKILYTNYSKPEVQTGAEIMAEAKYLEACKIQIAKAKDEVLNATYIIATNAGSAAFHVGAGLVAGARLAVIGIVEAGKYILPPVANFAINTS